MTSHAGSVADRKDSSPELQGVTICGLPARASPGGPRSASSFSMPPERENKELMRSRER